MTGGGGIVTPVVGGGGIVITVGWSGGKITTVMGGGVDDILNVVPIASTCWIPRHLAPCKLDQRSLLMLNVRHSVTTRGGELFGSLDISSSSSSLGIIAK